jgi:hypothetical protein
MTKTKTKNGKSLYNADKEDVTTALSGTAAVAGAGTAAVAGTGAALGGAVTIAGAGAAVAAGLYGMIASLSSFKTTLYIPSDKKAVYEKYKALVPDVSGKIVEFIEDYVARHETSQAGMSEQTIHKGVTHKEDGIFLGTAAKFIGVKIAEGPRPAPNEDQALSITVYLTKKNKFLYAWELEDGTDRCRSL